nr:MAG TPA: hypothetical protein [Caudoviricetes sp.]
MASTIQALTLWPAASAAAVICALVIPLVRYSLTVSFSVFSACHFADARRWASVVFNCFCCKASGLLPCRSHVPIIPRMRVKDSPTFCTKSPPYIWAKRRKSPKLPCGGLTKI